MKVSIIIPVYNVADYIENCIISVVSQDYNDLEIILIDDASPDNSITIATNILNSSGRNFKIITHQTNKGLSAARNNGILAATGEYIFFLDSDDELYSSKSISILAENALTTSADCIAGNYLGVKKDYSYESRYSKNELFQNDSLIQAFTTGKIPIIAWNKLLRRSFILSNSLYFKEGILNEDELFTFQMIILNPLISICGKLTYRYNIREGSIMTTMNIHRLLSPIIVHEEIVKSYNNAAIKDKRLLINIDHFAFRRHVAVMQSMIEQNDKYKLYARLRKSQLSIKGVGRMRYLYNFHLFMPKNLGYYIMHKVAQIYSRSRNI